MPSAFDIKFMTTLQQFMQKGQLLELDHIEHYGQQVPVFKNSPPNLHDFFAYFVQQHADKEFLIDGDSRLTFGETYAAARALAGGLVEGWGVQPGDRIGIAARNSTNWIILYMAIAMAGGVTVKVNAFWNGDEMAASIKDVDTKIVFCDDQRAARLEQSISGHGAQIEIFEHDRHPLEGLKVLLSKGGGAESKLPTAQPCDNATILFTSGSTGRSKGAVSTHRAVVQGAMSFVGAFAVVASIMDKDGTLPDIQPSALVSVPLFHVTASVPLLLVSFALGRKLVLMKKWDAVEAMRLIEKEKVTYFVGVPLMSIEIYTHPRRYEFDLSSCVSVAAGGAPRPVDHVHKIKESMGDNGFPIIGYGLTETNGVGCSNQNENYIERPNSTGRATPPLVEVQILDDYGQSLPGGERGEVCIRTAALFSGYWNNPEATATAMTSDGFFRTGDIGYLDEEGFLFIVDRKKDIIIRGGENISCQEVEDVAYSLPYIAEACVFGVVDERYGEVPAIVYTTKPGEEASLEKLRDDLSKGLAPFKLPCHGEQSLENLPRLGTAKIDRITIASRFREKLSESA